MLLLFMPGNQNTTEMYIKKTYCLNRCINFNFKITKTSFLQKSIVLGQIYVRIAERQRRNSHNLRLPN